MRRAGIASTRSWSVNAPSKSLLTPLFFFFLIVLQVKEIVQLVHEGEKTVSHDGSRVEEAEDGKDGDVGEGEGETEGDRDG